METAESPTPLPRVRAFRPRRAELDRHQGDLINHVLNLQHVARCIEMAMTLGGPAVNYQGAVEHLADQLDQLADRLCKMDIRPAAPGAA